LLVIIMGAVIGVIFIAGVISCIYYIRWRRIRSQTSIEIDRTDDVILFARTKVVKTVEGDFESSFNVDDFSIADNG